jgi:cation:H+ antiporter
MDIILYLLLFIVSLAVLLKASSWFIDSAERIGLSFGISPFIIGVTIIAFGTSLPELATSVAAVLAGTSEIVVGNVLGSNITNILLVLGLTAFVGKSIKLDYNVMDIDMPLLFGSAFILLYALQDLQISMFEAILFLAGLIIFLANSFTGKEKDDIDLPNAKPRDYIMLIIGAALVSFGAHYTIVAVESLSEMAGVDPDVIALTVIAFGTSLPEIVVSIQCIKKGKAALAVGNVLGSNIFNTYAVMSIPSLFGTLVIPETTLQFSGPFMVVVTILFGLICLSGRISRWEGGMLILFYIFFLGELVNRTL